MPATERAVEGTTPDQVGFPARFFWVANNVKYGDEKAVLTDQESAIRKILE